MSGTFSALSTTLSALRYNRVAMDVAGGNVANVGTEGYARRGVVGQAQGAPSVPALWSRWDGAGNGVSVGGVERMTDALLDVRARTEHGNLSSLSTRSASLVRVESTLGEPGPNGVAAALTAFQQGWHDVANNPGDGGTRSQLLARANTLVSTIHTQARSVDNEWSNQRSGLAVAVAEVNGITADLAALNKGIKSASVTGTDAGVLLDKRDQLAMRLADLTGASTTIAADGSAQVTLDGRTLVDGRNANQLTVAGATTLGGGAVTLAVTGSVGTVGPVTSAGGSVGGGMDLLNATLPSYMATLDGFVAQMAATVNGLHTDDPGGARTYDGAGAPGGAFFGTDDGSPVTASTIRVVIADPVKIAAATTLGPSGEPTLDGTNADALGSADIGGGMYRELVAGFGVDVASARRNAENQGVVTSQIDGSREALSGINIDEEMVNLLAAQRAYEGAARVLTTLDSILDTLINRTGVTR